MDLVEQLVANRQMWEALVELGTEEGGPLETDVYFYCPDERSALGVVDGLTALGDRAEAVEVRRGVLRRRTQWAVTGQRRIDPVSLDALDDLVREMAVLAATHGAEFDGWGAQPA